MARILISFFSNVTWLQKIPKDSFIEEFTNVLVRRGNDCMSVFTNRVDDNTDCTVDYDRLKNDIVKFNPELIISFNNVLPAKNILKYVNCPVACFSADSPAWWMNKDIISKYKDRYYFFHFSPDMIECTKTEFDVSDDRNVLFGIATDFQKRNLEKTKNICFVGSFNIWNKSLIDTFDRFPFDDDAKRNFIEKMDMFEQNPLKNTDWKLSGITDDEAFRAAQLLLTARDRLQIAESLSDLGLTVFTAPNNINDLLLFHWNIWKCVRQKTVCSLSDIEDVYNSSKICLNMPHAQAENGFSWRVSEILASSSCLLSNRKPYLTEITKDYVDLPMYDSPAEARDLCVKLLKDEIFRQDVVLASNKLVDDKFRFEDKFEKMFKKIGLLENLNFGVGKNTDLFLSDYIINNDDLFAEPGIVDKIRYRIWKHLNKKLKSKKII